MDERKGMSALPCCHIVETALLHTQRATRAAYLMKRANIVIVQQDVTGNIIWANEHFPKKVADVVYNGYQCSDDAVDNEDFDESEFWLENAGKNSDTE